MVKVSVIVPVYGVEKYIKKCISSIINQTFSDFEIIVVDDGTKDNSIKIIKDNFHDDRIKIFHKENGGLASARNYGITKASGKYMFFVDSDDFLEPNCLLEMYNEIINKDVDMVICDYYKYFENGHKTHEKMIPFYDKENNKCHVISMPCSVCKLIKSNIIKDNKITFLENHYF
jgi:glycosyltransferase involved in cell wall biosynthesis